MNVRAPCVRCGNILHTGEGRVVLAFTADELEELVFATSDPAVRRRMLCAIGLLDQKREERITASSVPHNFAGDGYDCTRCGEGRCYYLHSDRPEQTEG